MKVSAYYLIVPGIFKKVKTVSISEILKIFILGVIYRKFDQVRQAVPVASRQSGEALVNIGQVIIVG